MTEKELNNRFPSNAEYQPTATFANPHFLNPQAMQQDGNVASNVVNSDYSSQVNNIVLRDLTIIENLAKAGILNPVQGQHLANYILNKAQEVLVPITNTQATSTKYVPASGIEEFAKEKPEFFKDNARAQVLDYIKNSNAEIDKDGILQISKLVETLEDNAINKYLQKQAHEKSLNYENETAKQRLKANAQNQMPSENNTRIFTREQIGKMRGAEFAKNEKAIMEQARQGLIR